MNLSDGISDEGIRLGELEPDDLDLEKALYILLRDPSGSQVKPRTFVQAVKLYQDLVATRVG